MHQKKRNSSFVLEVSQKSELDYLFIFIQKNPKKTPQTPSPQKTPTKKTLVQSKCPVNEYLMMWALHFSCPNFRKKQLIFERSVGGNGKSWRHFFPAHLLDILTNADSWASKAKDALWKGMEWRKLTFPGGAASQAEGILCSQSLQKPHGPEWWSFGNCDRIRAERPTTLANSRIAAEFQSCGSVCLSIESGLSVLDV